MSRVRTLVAVAACAVATLGLSAAGADAHPESRFRAAEAAEGVVTSLAVLPASGRAEVIISLDGHTKVQNFTLRGPERIVVDISGVSLGLPARGYDRVDRGGIRDVRWSQFTRNVVRVVLTLDRQREYTVIRSEGGITIAVQADSGKTFTAWHAAGERKAAPEQQVARVPVQDAQPTAAVEPLRDVVMADVQAPGTVLAGAPREAVVQTRNDAMASTNRERPAMQQRQQQPRISVAWSNADIREVLAQFAAFSGRTIIVGRGVNATVTAEIIDQPWDVAMAAILSSQGLAATEDLSGIIVVDTYESIAQRRTSEPLATRTLRLNYARAGQAAENLRQRLTRDCSSRQGGAALRQGQGTLTDVQTPTAQVGLSGPTDLSCPIRGAVTADSLTNSISITDVPGALPGLVEYARSLDIRQPQVAIKAKIVLVDRTSLEALGIKYDIGTRGNFFNTLLPRLDSAGAVVEGAGRFQLGGNALAGVANASAQIPNAALNLVYSAALGRFDLTTFLDALQETTLLDVQSEPSVVTLNNRTAELRAGVEVPIRVIEANAGGGEGGFPRATVQLRQTGIILNVTPQITANRQIIMRVVAENSDVDFRASDVGAVFPTQRVENEMLVADGETAVMGGLTQTRVNVTKSGIPILVDLPIIGRLFGVTQRSESKRDLLILITPHIVDEGQTMPDGNDDR
ncbi:MAG: AMIN domain-containing protein [Gemmatimonadaceae bacterium]|nr:AMIN domain-containing protein [Gemmatimonadaceae bacterium]